MDTTPSQGDRAAPETVTERERRVVQETRQLTEARASLEAGFYVDADDIDLWIDSLGSEHELSPPPVRRR